MGAHIRKEEKDIQNALRYMYPGRFTDSMRIKLLPDQGWFNQTFLLEDTDASERLVLRTRKATQEQQQAHSKGGHWSPYFKEAWAIQTAHLGVPVAAIECNDIGYFYVKTPDCATGSVLYAYLLQEYLPYDTAASVIAESSRVDFFEHIGTVARQVNATSVKGFGDTFDEIAGGFTHDSWESYLLSELELFQRARGQCSELLSPALFTKACARILESKSLAKDATLYHLDFVKNWNNILVDEYECITGVIDWEFAGAGPATHCELASTLYVYYRDNASVFERRKEFNALLSGYGLSLRAYASNFRYDVESLVLRHCLNGLCKYVHLLQTKNLDSQPWREVHAKRAADLIELIVSRKRLVSYVSNPLKRLEELAA